MHKERNKGREERGGGGGAEIYGWIKRDLKLKKLGNGERG